jgi:hypothetical protein
MYDAFTLTLQVNLVNGKSVPIGDGWHVLGDQLRDSLDSRYEGPVRKNQIVGHAWLRVWPLSRYGDRGWMGGVQPRGAGNQISGDVRGCRRCT